MSLVAEFMQQFLTQKTSINTSALSYTRYIGRPFAGTPFPVFLISFHLIFNEVKQIFISTLLVTLIHLNSQPN